jgi:hypothetical protein
MARVEQIPDGQPDGLIKGLLHPLAFLPSEKIFLGSWGIKSAKMHLYSCGHRENPNSL